MSVRIPVDRRWLNATRYFVEQNGGDIYRLRFQAGILTQAEHDQRLFDEFGCRVVECNQLEFRSEKHLTAFLLRWS